jgi:hypothetical protein
VAFGSLITACCVGCGYTSNNSHEGLHVQIVNDRVSTLKGEHLKRISEPISNCSAVVLESIYRYVVCV